MSDPTNPHHDPTGNAMTPAEQSAPRGRLGMTDAEAAQGWAERNAEGRRPEVSERAAAHVGKLLDGMEGGTAKELAEALNRAGVNAMVTNTETGFVLTMRRDFGERLIGLMPIPPDGPHHERSHAYLEPERAPKTLGDAMRLIGRYTESEGGKSAETMQARTDLFDAYETWCQLGRPENAEALIPEPEKNWCLVHGPRSVCATATAGVCNPVIAVAPSMPRRD